MPWTLIHDGHLQKAELVYLIKIGSNCAENRVIKRICENTGETLMKIKESLKTVKKTVFFQLLKYDEVVVFASTILPNFLG